MGGVQQCQSLEEDPNYTQAKKKLVQTIRNNPGTIMAQACHELEAQATVSQVKVISPHNVRLPSGGKLYVQRR